VKKRGYRIVYFSSKPQRESFSPQIPAGPILCSPDSLVRFVGGQSSEAFKAAALRGVKLLFPQEHTPLYAGFCAKVSETRYSLNAFELS
jgi:phosphatidate phosphatase PAH1